VAGYGNFDKKRQVPRNVAGYGNFDKKDKSPGTWQVLETLTKKKRAAER
jgi:hypothetical protein